MQEEGDADRSAQATFDAMAPIYDSFTAHHRFGEWLQALLERLARHGLQQGRLLDVACGTGRSFRSMLERGWEVTACDVSPAMLEIAHDRVGDAVHLELADMRALPRFGSFDLVWALGDVVNYLPHTADMERALRKMQLNLAPEGLLLFDLSTLLVFQTWFTGTEVVEHEGMRMIWTGQMTSDVSPGSLCTARLEVDEGPTRAEPHIHRMRHFSEAEVLDALAEAGLECLDVCGHHHDGVLKQPLSEAEHTKAIYIARAARPS